MSDKPCEECRVNCVEFADETVCAWCIAKHREEEDKPPGAATKLTPKGFVHEEGGR